MVPRGSEPPGLRAPHQEGRGVQRVQRPRPDRAAPCGGPGPLERVQPAPEEGREVRCPPRWEGGDFYRFLQIFTDL